MSEFNKRDGVPPSNKLERTNDMHAAEVEKARARLKEVIQIAFDFPDIPDLYFLHLQDAADLNLVDIDGFPEAAKKVLLYFLNNQNSVVSVRVAQFFQALSPLTMEEVWNLFTTELDFSFDKPHFQSFEKILSMGLKALKLGLDISPLIVQYAYKKIEEGNLKSAYRLLLAFGDSPWAVKGAEKKLPEELHDSVRNFVLGSRDPKFVFEIMNFFSSVDFSDQKQLPLKLQLNNVNSFFTEFVTTLKGLELNLSDLVKLKEEFLSALEIRINAISSENKWPSPSLLIRFFLDWCEQAIAFLDENLQASSDGEESDFKKGEIQELRHIFFIKGRDIFIDSFLNTERYYADGTWCNWLEYSKTQWPILSGSNWAEVDGHEERIRNFVLATPKISVLPVLKYIGGNLDYTPQLALAAKLAHETGNWQDMFYIMEAAGQRLLDHPEIVISAIEGADIFLEEIMNPVQDMLSAATESYSPDSPRVESAWSKENFSQLFIVMNRRYEKWLREGDGDNLQEYTPLTKLFKISSPLDKQELMAAEGFKKARYRNSIHKLLLAWKELFGQEKALQLLNEISREQKILDYYEKYENWQAEDSALEYVYQDHSTCGSTADRPSQLQEDRPAFNPEPEPYPLA